MTRFLRLLAAALALFALNAQAANVAPVGIFDNIQAVTGAGQPATAEQIKDAMNAGGGPRGWLVTQVGPSQLVATVNVRNKHIVSVDVLVAPGLYSMKYKGSTNMNYDGVRINPSYNKWLQTLIVDTNRELSRK